MIDVESHLGLVYSTARKLYRLQEVEGDDVLGAGALALVQAGHAYRPESGVPFPAFAALRIRWAILDYLRAVYGQGRRPETWHPSEGGTESGRRAVDARLDSELLLSLLEAQERWVLEQFYLEERPLKEIAAELRVTASRVCQIKQSAIRRLRAWTEEPSC